MAAATEKLRLLFFGASGRMGVEIRAILKEQGDKANCRIAAGVVAPSDPECGKIVEGVELPLAAVPPEGVEFDGVVDFSSPAAAPHSIEFARSRKLPLLIGTSGLDQTVLKQLEAAARETAVLRSANTSVGVTVLLDLVSRATAGLGPEFEVEIVETHHHGKQDSPSGTAIALGEAVAKERGVPLSDVSRAGRDGISPRAGLSEIGFHSLRAGSIAGEHTVYFFSQGERLELTHRSGSRRVFAEGALRVAEWLIQHTQETGETGVFSMRDAIFGRARPS